MNSPAVPASRYSVPPLGGGYPVPSLGGTDWEQTLCTLILHGGDARCAAKEAADYAAEHQWQEADEAMKRANEAQLAAHKIQAEILHREARGEAIPFSILLVHSLDLLLLAWAEIDYAEQFIKLHRRIAELEARP